MLKTGVVYGDLGGDHYTKLNPDKTKQRALNQLRQMGYRVTLSPLPARAKNNRVKSGWLTPTRWCPAACW